MWHHPKYYKELRKLRNKLDQAISKDASTEATSVRPGPGLKQQAIDETVPHNDIEEASGAKRQAAKPQGASFKLQEQQALRGKLQAPSCKGQASSRKHQAPLITFPLIKFYGPGR